jgi:hypothetical protein
MSIDRRVRAACLAEHIGGIEDFIVRHGRRWYNQGELMFDSYFHAWRRVGMRTLLDHASRLTDHRATATSAYPLNSWRMGGLQVVPQALALTYTGLTRVKRHAEHSYITVVSAIPELAEYGRTWMDYLER